MLNDDDIQAAEWHQTELEMEKLEFLECLLGMWETRHITKQEHVILRIAERLGLSSEFKQLIAN